MSILTRKDNSPFNHITTVDIDKNGGWNVSCLCGFFKGNFPKKKHAENVENRHKIIVGSIVLEDDETGV